MDIDLVYTWVNPADDAKARLRESYASEARGTHGEYRAGVSRFRDNGELRSSIQTALRFLPFIRRIFIVSSGEAPTWLKGITSATFIQEDDLLPTSVRPSFASDTIEAFIHRIPDLAERYLYANDDYFFAREHSPADFYTSEGRCLVGVGEAFAGIAPALPVYHAMEVNSVRALMRHVPLSEFEYFGDERRRGSPLNHLRSRMTAGLRGLALLNVPTHVAQPYLKTPWSEFHSVFARELQEMLVHKFRSVHGIQVNFTYLHFLRARGRAAFTAESRHLYLDWTKGDPDRARLLSVLRGEGDSITRFCLNDSPAPDGPIAQEWSDFTRDVLKTVEKVHYG